MSTQETTPQSCFTIFYYSSRCGALTAQPTLNVGFASVLAKKYFKGKFNLRSGDFVQLSNILLSSFPWLIDTGQQTASDASEYN